LVSVIRSAALVGLVLSFAVMANAQEGPGEDPARDRFYLGGGLNYGVPDFADYNSTNRDAEATFGFDLRFGHRWRWVAAEFSTQYYNNFDLTDSLTRQKGEIRAVTAGPSVKFYPLPTWRIQPYALGGFGLLYTNDREDINAEDGLNFMLRPGGGLEVEMLPGIIVFAEGSYVFGIQTKRDMIPVILGVQFHL
jgi:hypothetical protein